MDAFSISFTQDGKVLTLRDSTNAHVAVFAEGMWAGAVRATSLMDDLYGDYSASKEPTVFGFAEPEEHESEDQDEQDR